MKKKKVIHSKCVVFFFNNYDGQVYYHYSNVSNCILPVNCF